MFLSLALGTVNAFSTEVASSAYRKQKIAQNLFGVRWLKVSMGRPVAFVPSLFHLFSF
jgi:hypothetical protein